MQGNKTWLKWYGAFFTALCSWGGRKTTLFRGITAVWKAHLPQCTIVEKKTPRCSQWFEEDGGWVSESSLKPAIFGQSIISRKSSVIDWYNARFVHMPAHDISVQWEKISIHCADKTLYSNAHRESWWVASRLKMRPFQWWVQEMHALQIGPRLTCNSNWVWEAG